MTRKLPEEIRRARAQWRYRGDERPDFAEAPTAGQESVWDYPRPPSIVPDSRRVRVSLGDALIADSNHAVRVLETASPPGFYVPPNDVHTEHLEECGGQSFCEWKGRAQYWSVKVGDHRLENVGWCYLEPLEGFESICGYLSFYPGRLTCIVGDEQAFPQPGGFYGGWVTSEIVGPFKGAPGTEWW